MLRELFDQERARRHYSVCEKMIYCPLWTSKAPPLGSFETAIYDFKIQCETTLSGQAAFTAHNVQ